MTPGDHVRWPSRAGSFLVGTLSRVDGPTATVTRRDRDGKALPVERVPVTLLSATPAHWIGGRV